jgi:hypothetical protein
LTASQLTDRSSIWWTTRVTRDFNYCRDCESDRPNVTSLGIDQCQNTTSPYLRFVIQGQSYAIAQYRGSDASPESVNLLSFSSTVPYVRVTRGTAKFLKSTDPIYWSGLPQNYFLSRIGTPNCARLIMYQLLLARLTYCGSLTEDLDKTRISSFIIWPHIYQSGFRALNVRFTANPELCPVRQQLLFGKWLLF